MWLKTVFAMTSLVIGVLTVVWPTWIEAVFDVDPDHGSGALEWAVAGSCLCLAVGFGLAARRGHVARRTGHRTRTAGAADLP